MNPRFFARALRMDPASLERMQARRLRSLIRHAYDQVPLYRSLWDEARVAPEDLRSLSDLGRLPIVTKEMLREAGPRSFLARNVDPSSCLRGRTSGSTGEPFTVYLTRRERALRQWIHLRSLRAVGFRPWDRLAVLATYASPTTPLHQKLGLFRRKIVSPWLPIDEQIRRLAEARPDLLFIYPSHLNTILHHSNSILPAGCRPRSILTAAEVADPRLVERIRTELAAEHFNFYGAIEFGRIAWECRAHRGLHVNADLAIVECVREPRMNLEDGLGVTVVTALNGFAMPFIRYRLGDLSAPIEGDCPCGVRLPRITAPIGRASDLARLPGGRTVPCFTFHAVLRPFEEIRKFRVIQESEDLFTIELVLAREGTPDLVRRVRERTLEVLRAEVRVEIRILDSIPETKRKFVTFVSRLRKNGAPADS